MPRHATVTWSHDVIHTHVTSLGGLTVIGQASSDEDIRVRPVLSYCTWALPGSRTETQQSMAFVSSDSCLADKSWHIFTRQNMWHVRQTHNGEQRAVNEFFIVTFTLMSFQTRTVLFLQWNTKREIAAADWDGGGGHLDPIGNIFI